MISNEKVVNYRPVRLAYKPYFFSQRTIFFSHNKSANSTFSHDLSAKRTGQSKSEWLYCSQWELIDATLAVQAARAIPSLIRSEPQGAQCYSIKKKNLMFQIGKI